MRIALTFVVSYPPTSNHRLLPGRGRLVKAPKYRHWMEQAVNELAQQHRGIRFTGAYSISYSAERPDRVRRDIENLPKAFGDALQQAGIVADDANCRISTAKWLTGAPVGRSKARVFITLTANDRDIERISKADVGLLASVSAAGERREPS